MSPFFYGKISLETELEETFLIFDKTGDQELDVEEAGRMWRSTGLNPTKSEIQEMFNEIDQDGKSDHKWLAYKVQLNWMEEVMNYAWQLLTDQLTCELLLTSYSSNKNLVN